jgi:hypothetical protein
MKTDGCYDLGLLSQVWDTEPGQYYQEAEPELLAGYQNVSKKTDPSNYWLKAARQDLAQVYEALNRPEKAAKFRMESAGRR